MSHHRNHAGLGQALPARRRIDIYIVRHVRYLHLDQCRSRKGVVGHHGQWEGVKVARTLRPRVTLALERLEQLCHCLRNGLVSYLGVNQPIE